MTIHEANDRLKKAKIANEEQLWQITPLYILLDFHKDDFCKLVDAVGLDKILEKTSRWERLDRAERELAAKERYLNAKARLEELEREKENLTEIVNGYKGV
jgi:hypothetical protein